jgi:adenosine deaminase
VSISAVSSRPTAYSYKDFWHFLTVYETATSVLKTPEDYARLTRAVLEESAENGVVYSRPSSAPISAAGAMWKHGANT